MGERGRTALTEAQAEERQLTAPAEKIALEPPLLLLEPAPHSEELDYLLVVPLGSGELERHRSRLRRIAALQAEEHFEFVQFRDEVAALPITPRLAALDLLPRETTLSVIRETGALDGLGVRACPDRGVNYGRGWLQWFGGFDPESPLIVSRRVSFEEFELVSGSGPG